MIPGIDVSHYQGTIDWAKVKASGVQFAYIKATQGASFVDPKLAENVEGAASVEIPIGLYHVFVANSGEEQEHNWVKATRQYPAQLPAWLDVEPGAVTSDAAADEVLNLLVAGFFVGRDCVYSTLRRYRSISETPAFPPTNWRSRNTRMPRAFLSRGPIGSSGSTPRSARWTESLQPSISTGSTVTRKRCRRS